MSHLYIDETGIVLNVQGNRLKINYPDGQQKELPLEMVDGITMLSPVQMSAKCIQVCLQRDIPVMFYSKGGKYVGMLHSMEHVNAERQRMQCALYDTDFSIDFSRIIISGKIKNQEVRLYRYGKIDLPRTTNEVILLSSVQ